MALDARSTRPTSWSSGNRTSTPAPWPSRRPSWARRRPPSRSSRRWRHRASAPPRRPSRPLPARRRSSSRRSRFTSITTRTWCITTASIASSCTTTTTITTRRRASRYNSNNSNEWFLEWQLWKPAAEQPGTWPGRNLLGLTGWQVQPKNWSHCLSYFHPSHKSHCPE